MTETEYRLEKDFLGSKQVEHQAYYGIQTLRAVENFPITGYRVHHELIKAMGIVSNRCARQHGNRPPL